MKYLRGADEIFDEAPQYIAERHKYFDDKKAVYLNIRSSDPDLMGGVDPDRIRRSAISSERVRKAHRNLTMSNAVRWSIVALPSPAWAKKVFPGIGEAEAMDKLWALILKGARADGSDPIADWAAHKKNFEKRVSYLNGEQFTHLKFSNSLGTDFTLGIVKGHIWEGGGDVGKDGVPFFPNIPTEEIFTMPDRNRAEGRVVASMPLSYSGNLIEGFEITFKGGKAVSWKASANEKVLADIIGMDEGSARPGEIALVESTSPIAQMKTLFYETLFDENASCHLALGKAYPNNMKGSENMTEEERKSAGCNDSLVHVDFMFGTADMKITGVRQDGSEAVFFENGVFKGI
jgi:aminopeptidase